MSLVAGTRLGPYEILGLIGAGGMGEVYKARDTRLDRSVAIKVLPTELSADPERRARFEREARAIAALAHPHICTLHDIGEHIPSGPLPLAPGPLPLSPVHYLVMEHLAGESLAERLKRGPVPLAQALDLAAQIAEALDAAHKHGIVHRDLKPGNVMLTTGGAGRSGVTSAKLLDFGLAKAVGPNGGRGFSPGGHAGSQDPASKEVAAALTQTAPITARGTILGTLPYMAPEQLEGKEADARTDLWALGAILYEMVTGRRAFEGDSQVSLIGNIMNAEPAGLATLQPLTPPALERVVKKCLAKHPDDRWDTAHDVADELRWIAQTSSASSPAISGIQPRRRRAPRMALLAAGVLAGAMIGAGVMWLLRPVQPRSAIVRSTLEVLPAEDLNAGGTSSFWIPTPGGSRTALTFTPDGQALVFVGRQGRVQQLYVRRLDAAEARPLAGTEGAEVPAVSADGQWVGFWANGAVRKVPLAGGPVMSLRSGLVRPPWGLVWDTRGGLLFGGEDGRIWVIPAEGPPSTVTTLGEGQLAHTLPWPLPDGRALLYTVRRRSWSWGDEQIVAQSLATGARKVVVKDAADARYLPTGHLLFLRRGVLSAVPFDAERLEVRGPEVAVLDAVAQALTASNAFDITGAGQFAAAATGSLAWLANPVVLLSDAALVTVDRRGQVSPLPAPVRSYGPSVRLSPDGRRLAVVIRSLTEAGVWIYDLARGSLTLLAGGGETVSPIWSPDGRRLLFDWLTDGRRALAAQPADGTASPQVLVPNSWLNASSVTPDGRQMAAVHEPDTDILSVAVENGQARVQPLIQTPHYEGWAEFSPDGRWLAYGSDVSGRREVYVRPYPGPGPTEQVSIDGGQSPAWHPGGNELFFVSPRNPAGMWSMMAVDVDAGSARGIGRPRLLFEFDPVELKLICAPMRCYDVAPDGQRFFAVQRRPTLPRPPVTHVNLILNWFEELKAKVPGGQAK